MRVLRRVATVTGAALFGVVALMGSWGASSSWAVEPFALYDDFETKPLDPTKWVGLQNGAHVLEAQRKLSKGQLKIQNRAYATTDSDTGRERNIVGLNFTDAASVTAIEAIVEVQKFEATGCATPGADATLASARLLGHFFNTDSPTPGSALDDVVAFIQVNHLLDTTPAGSLVVIAMMVQCTDENCLSNTLLDTANLGLIGTQEPAKLRIEWDPDNDQFLFQRDEDPEVALAYEVSDAASSGRAVKGLHVTHFVPNCTATPQPAAFVKAVFDDVFVNESAGIPNIAGRWEGMTAVNNTGCSHPEDNGPGTESITLDITQDGATFTATDGEGTTLTGHLAVDGALTGDLVGMEEDEGEVFRSEGTFNGNVTGSTLTVSFQSQDISGDTCTTTGSFTLERQ